MIKIMKYNYMKLLSDKQYLNDIIGEEDGKVYKIKFRLRNGYVVPLIIVFDDFFPAHLPLVSIDTDCFHVPKKPHILRSGLICYLDKEGVIWDTDPSILLDLVFERVEDILLANSEIVEFHREFNYYFSTLNNLKTAFSIYNKTNRVEQINVYTGKNSAPICFLADDEQSIKMLERLYEFKITNLPNKALFIPLDKTYKGNVPQGDQFWSAEEIQNLILEHTTEEKIEQLKIYAKNKNNYYYLLEIPLITGQRVTIGLWYKKIEGRSTKSVPIIEYDPSQVFEILPIFICREDDNSLIKRGGGLTTNSRILLVGCGSIGSDILFLLARSGIKEFTIVDNDKLSMENSYRHFLGMNMAIKAKAKVDLLKKEIETRYPNTNVEAVNADILVAISNKQVDLEEFSLIIFAIGDPNVERKLNELVLETNTPAIFTWVEAYGIGGHALLVNITEKGCYECLIKEDLSNYAAFAGKSDIPYTMNINGCSGTFTPYGGVDSMQTALIATRLALSLVRGETTENCLVSWKGQAKQFRENGFSTSSRYEESLDVLENGTTNFIRTDCQVCGKRGLK